MVVEPVVQLRPHVTSYTGYRIAGFEPGVHAGLPSASLTLIVAFDEPLDLVAVPHPDQGPGRYRTLLAGLHARPAMVRHDGSQHGMQLELTPLGAMALFGLRPADMALRVESLDQIDQRFARQLVDRLATAPSWRARFDALDAMLVTRLDQGAAIEPRLDRAWDLLIGSGGRIGVADLASRVDLGRRHLSEQFRRTFGLPPKTMANVVRFERAQHLLRRPGRRSLADVAAVCGYSDQAHMTRQWHTFAGSSPSAWLGDERLPIVQDDDPAAVRP